MRKRIPLFVSVNILLTAALVVPLASLGTGRPRIAAFSLLWAVGSAFVWLLLCRWILRDEQRQLLGAKDAINTLVRRQVAQGLAARFLERSRPYEQSPELSAMLDQGLLHKAAFVQKPPFLLNFYRRLLLGLGRVPQGILEIGVKGGGSTALWKAVFPAARVVGMDLKLRRWLRESDDGVVYVEGDQADRARLEQIAAEHGPFDLVIDDGSHISDDQAITMRSLLPHVLPGGLYIVEDTHAHLKTDRQPDQVDYGEDIWTDFVITLFERRRSRAFPSSPRRGTQLAFDIGPLVDDLIISTRVLAIRVARRSTSADAAADQPPA
jgi:hypothetical protein